ncbi:MAG: hypothetical protein HY519_02795 [Candidatus Aenigmarchaeota archaeon]|nr:hypothetical protein [Candidatus Aenigmarchaeota archaeon]
MATKRLALVGLTITALAVLLLVPGGAYSIQGQEHEEMAAVELHVHMGEFSFQVDGQEPGMPLEIEAGMPYLLAFHIDGQIVHEAMLGKGVKDEDGMPHGYASNLLDNIEVRLIGEMRDSEFEVETMGLIELELNREQLLEVKFTLPEELAGEWELGCFIPGHYEAGMKLPIIVN